MKRWNFDHVENEGGKDTYTCSGIVAPFKVMKTLPRIIRRILTSLCMAQDKVKE